MAASGIRRIGAIGAIVTLIAVLVLALPAGVGARPDRGGTAKLTPVKLLVDFFPVGLHAPIFAAMAEKYFAQQGLEVSLEFSPTAASVQNLIAGKGDIAYAPAVNFLLARLRTGVALKSLYTYQQTNPMAVLALASSGISKLSDLKGKTIVDFAGSATQIVFPVVLRRNHIDQSSIGMRLVAPQARVPALLAHQADAMLAFWPDNTPLVQSLCSCTVNVIKFDDNGVHQFGNGFVATPDFIAKNPGVLRGFFKAITKGALFAQANPEKAIDDEIATIGATATGNRAVQVQVVKNLSLQLRSATSKKLNLPLGRTARGDWLATIGGFVAGGALQFSGSDVPGVYTNEFVPCYTGKTAATIKFVTCPKTFVKPKPKR
jgi:NitT/TauT family transport system substrate-binding protein